ERETTLAGKMGGAGNEQAGAQRPGGALEDRDRLEAGLRLPVLALQARCVPRGWPRRAVVRGDSWEGCGGRDHGGRERLPAGVGRDLGSPAPGVRYQPAARRHRLTEKAETAGGKAGGSSGEELRFRGTHRQLFSAPENRHLRMDLGELALSIQMLVRRKLLS